MIKAQKTKNKGYIYILEPFIIIMISTSYFTITQKALFSYPDGWSDDIILTPEDNKNRGFGDLDVDCFNNVWVTWDTAILGNGTAEVLYRKIDSTGTIVTPELNMSQNSTYSIQSLIVVDNNNKPHLIWRDQTAQGLGVWHGRLANDGSILIPSHLCVAGTGDPGVSDIEIAIDNKQYIHVAWQEMYNSHEQMVYSKLDTLGNTIIEKIRVTPEECYAWWLGCGVDSFGNCHLATRTDTATTSFRLTYSKIDKNGVIVIANKVLTSGLHPSIVCDRSQNVHIVYYYLGSSWSKIAYIKLNQNGDILVGPKNISLPTIPTNLRPCLAIDSLQNLHLVWQADDGSSCSIMYAKLDTVGDFIVTPYEIVGDPYVQYATYPRIAVDYRNRLHVIWTDTRSGVAEDIYYKYTTGEIGIKDESRKKTTRLSLLKIYPNPFRSKTTISGFSESMTTHCFMIYDVTGRIVKTISADKNAVVWDGSSNTGESLPPGVYLIRYLRDKTLVTEKVIKFNN